MLIQVNVNDIKTSGVKETGANATAISCNVVEESQIETVGCRIPNAENGTYMASF